MFRTREKVDNRWPIYTRFIRCSDGLVTSPRRQPSFRQKKRFGRRRIILPNLKPRRLLFLSKHDFRLEIQFFFCHQISRLFRTKDLDSTRTNDPDAWIGMDTEGLFNCFKIILLYLFLI